MKACVSMFITFMTFKCAQRKASHIQNTQMYIAQFIQKAVI